MKLNKPKHSLYRNGIYALEGFIEIVKNETSFKWQLLMFVVMSVVAWNLPIDFSYASILFLSLFIPVLAEVANSAIERVVDLVTKEYHVLAKQAKDAGATLVLLSLILTVGIWIAVLLVAFKIF
ncbi:MAG: diacylglycerol kinase [Epsilonproteobacteria bacterium]|nr:diacylglycerol kinase [Campylobacterota bacterium]OIO13969.1 MAG: diacylglycerol kinase [Helicobacteraceae bacterium CG1_02_36_14]PIP10091.1 MAG: diacylglycerol kinase [Sulfurimonas sp. CG23_combo_of_CG06-09_8_20_14_all_36_33]PIS26633.1 MAG: diacylglycerol kinase [Sulfurimonas sp. CG08_land_8_20_14_0_20_36_33]PIU33452.1 MAG: diacylglycerol kinase [Sulfurimonas sp. CG07_land_8_20_14_0_80_36_56]PIV05638.1 MAG: diacylglycerol kinase [Sulfurimonas sp. CG03_land_8_20_14_0_80_36_25]PIV35291.1 MA